MAKFGKRFDTCPKCGKRGLHSPRHWFGTLPHGTRPKVCKYCQHVEYVKE